MNTKNIIEKMQDEHKKYIRENARRILVKQFVWMTTPIENTKQFVCMTTPIENTSIYIV